MTVDAELRGDARDRFEMIVAELDLGYGRLCTRDSIAKRLGLVAPVADKYHRIVVECHTTPNDLYAPRDVVLGLDERVQTEAIEQLRAKLPFFRIAAAH